MYIQLFRSPEAEQKVPLADDELDGEEDDDTLERCGGCRRGMKNGAVRDKITAFTVVCWSVVRGGDEGYKKRQCEFNF